MKRYWEKLQRMQVLSSYTLLNYLRLVCFLLAVTDVAVAASVGSSTCSLVLNSTTHTAELFFNAQSIGTNWLSAGLPCTDLSVELRYPDQPADVRTITFTSDTMTVKFKSGKASTANAVAPVAPVLETAFYKLPATDAKIVTNIQPTGPCPITAAAKDGGTIQTPNQTFPAWLAEFKTQAVACGVSPATIEAAFQGVYLEPKILAIDGQQSEFNTTFSNYLKSRVTNTTIKQGKAMLTKYRTLLSKLTARYEVPASVLIAFWGLESNFGRDTGNYNNFVALSTLAYEGRRRIFYQQQLLAALQIIDAGHIKSQQMRGSWAGAMGHFQFMPTTFRDYAVDGDGDGTLDIWNSIPDALTSAANYLHTIGWRGQLAGLEISLPARFDAYDCEEQRYQNSYWSALGVTTADGTPLPYPEAKGSMLLPSGIEGPAFLVYSNFDIITQWNKSTFYALTVVNLSQRLVGGKPLGRLLAQEKPLSKEQVKSLQADLHVLGFEVGKADGMIGQKTRQAVCKYQARQHITPDAYPTPVLMDAVHTEALSKTP